MSRHGLHLPPNPPRPTAPLLTTASLMALAAGAQAQTVINVTVAADSGTTAAGATGCAGTLSAAKVRWSTKPLTLRPFLIWKRDSPSRKDWSKVAPPEPAGKSPSMARCHLMATTSALVSPRRMVTFWLVTGQPPAATICR